MATLIYLPSSGNAAITPSTWLFANQINPLTFAGVLNKISSALTTKLEATGTTSPITKAMLRYVIGPLAGQSISGTVRMIMSCMESNAGANANLAMAVKIIQPDGSDRATLLAVTSSDSAAAPYELTVSPLSTKIAYTSAEIEPLTLTTQTATAGDYLVIEIGFRSATTTSRNISLRYGDAAASDFAYTVGLTTDLNPWVEFSQTLTWQVTISDVQPAYLKGQMQISDSQPAYLKGGETISDQQPVFLQGRAQASDQQSAYLRGQAQITGIQAAYLEGISGGQLSDVQSAYLRGQAQASDQMPAYLKGQDQANDQQPAYLKGQAQANDQQPAYLFGQELASKVQTAYLEGYQIGQIVDVQPAYLRGQAQASDQQIAFLKGQAQVSGIQTIYLEGITEGAIDVSKVQHSFLFGMDPGIVTPDMRKGKLELKQSINIAAFERCIRVPKT